MEVNVNGVLFAAQGAGRMMVKYNVPGSIILIASMSGSIANKVGCFFVISYRDDNIATTNP